MSDWIYVISAKMIRGMLKIFPTGKIKHNRIVFCSFLGKFYACNPKYISEYIENNADEYELVWGFVNPQEHTDLSARGIKVLKYNSLKFILMCMSAKYIVTNTHDLTHIPFSKKQTVINTWHGGGAYKKVGNQKNVQSLADKFRDDVFKRTPYVYLSSCDMFTKTNIRESFNHKGIVLNTGMPRNDILIQQKREDIKDKVFEKYHIPRENKIVLYAPTFRAEREASDYEFDTKKVKETLKKRFGGEWSILIRMHYYVTQKLKQREEAYIDASEYEDMQELLYASEVLITDYSSSMWDFSQMFKPCFLYATDLNQYDADRGFYTNVYTWPFPIAQDNNGLINNIEKFDKRVYIENVKKHHEIYGSFEKGTACEAVFEYIKAH